LPGEHVSDGFLRARQRHKGPYAQRPRGEAYTALRAAGLLQLNQAVIQKQRKGEIADRAKEIEVQRTLPDEEELYALPLDEIRRRAAPGGWLR
jgi:hypothetical protein